MILCDLPYGVLNRRSSSAQWDKPLPLPRLWDQYNRIIKPNGAIVLFGQGMFTADLMKSNPSLWRYNLIWKKGNCITGFLNANRMPLRNHEDIVVFYKKQPTYNPQMTIAKPHKRGGGGGHRNTMKCYGSFNDIESQTSIEKYPISIITVSKEAPPLYHPTQKPVKLCEWLINTYTNPGETVLDNCMGSGSTGVAAINTKRSFIGIEMDPSYYQIATNRIDAAIKDNR